MGATDTPVLDFGWCLPWVLKPGWIPSMLSCLCDPQIHLWCDTCWLYRGQHGSWAFLIHILADMFGSIGIDLGQGSNPWVSVPHAISMVWYTTQPLRLGRYVAISHQSVVEKMNNNNIYYNYKGYILKYKN